MKNELIATTNIIATQMPPSVRCGSVPLGAANCTRPSTKALIAAKAWSWIAGEAESSGSRLTPPLLFREKRGDLILCLGDRRDAVQMTVGTDDLGGFDRRAVGGDCLHRFLD